MANIPSTPTWSPDVYQIETTDAVLGGPDGVINVQAKQLADRTAYLKQEVEAASAVADGADTKATSALSQIASIETAAGSAQANASAALAHKQGAQAAQALAEQARNAAQAAQAQAGDNAGFAYQASQTAQIKASEAQAAASAAVTAMTPTVAAKNGAVAARNESEAFAEMADADRSAAEAARDASAQSQAAAAASEASALSRLNDFRGRYYGQLASDPTVDPLGNPPDEGDIYAHPTEGLRRYSSGAWKSWATVPADLASTATGKGASMVGYLPAGTGAVATTVQTKLRETVSVLDFGADPTGVADSAVAINRAVKHVASKGGTVYYPPGKYRITRAIRLDDYDIETFTYSGNVRKNIVHQGAGRGATQIIADGFWTSIFSSFPEPFIASSAVQPQLKDPGTPGADQYVFLAENVVIDGFTLDCNYNVNVDGGATYGAHYESWGGTWPNGSTGASQHAADNYQYPVYAYNCSEVKVTNCDVVNSWFNGIEIYRCYGVVIDGNRIDHCGNKQNYLGYYSGVELDNATIRAIVNGNTFKACGNGVMSNGDPLYYVWQPVTQVVVSNNVFDNMTQNGIYAFDYIKEWTVIGNKFHGIGGSGIQFAVNQAPVSGRNPQWISIIGNSINDFNKSNTNGACGIRALGGGVVCSDNTVVTSSSNTSNVWGIIAQDPQAALGDGESYGIVVSGNHISGKLIGTNQSSGGGILAAGTNTVISNNNVISTWDGVSANRVWVAVAIASNNAVVESNNISGKYNYNNGKSPIAYISGTKPDVRDGKFSPLISVKTGSGRNGVSGWTVVDFTNYTPTLNYVGGVWSSTNNAFYVQIPGVYHVEYMVNFSNIGTPASPVNCMALVEKNGLTSLDATAGFMPGSGGLGRSAIIELSANEFITLKSYSASGSYTVETGTFLRATLMRPLF